MDSPNNFQSKTKNFWSAAKKLGSAAILWRRKTANGNGAKHAQRQKELDKKLVYSLSKSRIPNFTQLKYIKKFLDKREIWALRLSFAVLFLSLAFLGVRFVMTHLQIMPTSGGEYIEGLIGVPQHINPLYANINEADSDIAGLVYSALFKRDKSGVLIKDLVESYEVGTDNKTYTFTIRPDVKWHDDTDLTSDDVVFTFQAIKNDQYKSPLRGSFSGVEIEKIDERKFVLTLKDPYAAFLELLTFGIMPAGLWSQIPPESALLAGLNLKPIGSGPYKYDKLIKDEKTGLIKEYDLAVNRDYYGPKPYLDIKFRFYPNFTEMIAALNDNQIDGMSYLPLDFKAEVATPNLYNYHNVRLPQVTAIFFNQTTNPALADKKVRQALAYGINREFIVQKILQGNGSVIDSPILPNNFAYFSDVKKYNYDPAAAGKLLDEAGWASFSFSAAEIEQAEKDKASEDAAVKAKAETILSLGEGSWRKKGDEYLIVKLATIDRSENTQVLEDVKNYWEKLGVKTEIEIIANAQLNSEVIKPRNFEALFYGLIVGADPDIYVFWHSTQAEGGFNIANFKNKEADQLLEEARLTADTKARQEKYRRIQEILADELPVIFMYSPSYNYLQTKNVKGFAVSDILVPPDRFANIADWYINTSKRIVW